jgi:hypothetical protein
MGQATIFHSPDGYWRATPDSRQGWHCGIKSNDVMPPQGPWYVVSDLRRENVLPAPTVRRELDHEELEKAEETPQEPAETPHEPEGGSESGPESESGWMTLTRP